MNQKRETSRTTLRLPLAAKSWVQEQAQSKGISENAVLSLLVQEKMAAEAKFGRETSAAEIQSI